MYIIYIYINYIYIYTKTIPNQTSKFLLECSGLTTSTAWPTRTATFNSFISSRHLTVTHGTVQTCQYRQVFRVISSHIETYRVISRHVYTLNTLICAQLVHSNILKSLTVRNWKFSGCGSMHSHSLLVLIDCYQPSWSHGRYHVVQEVVAFTQNSVPEKLHGLT